jgi:hypothetical protein
MSIRHLSISDVEDPKYLSNSLWVLNSGPSSPYQLEGTILLSIPGTSGQQQAQALKIPATWLAVDLTMSFPKHRILESTDFRSAVRNELLTIIDDATAKRINNQEGATEERKRLLAEARRIREAGAARTIKDSNATITRVDGIKEDEDENPVDVYGTDEEDLTVARAALKGLDVDENGLTPKFVMFAQKVVGSTDIHALNALKTRSRFTRREYKYLRDNLKHHPKTVAAIKAKLAEMSSAKKRAAA